MKEHWAWSLEITVVKGSSGLVLWDFACVPVKVLPPANVSVTVMENQEYELRWIKHALRYDFIKQRYQVEYWKNSQYEKVTPRKSRSLGFLFAEQRNGISSHLHHFCTSFFSPDCPEVKHQQWWASLHLHPADAGIIYRVQGENACKGEYASGLWGALEWMEWGVHLEDWERYISCRLLL